MLVWPTFSLLMFLLISKDLTIIFYLYRESGVSDSIPSFFSPSAEVHLASGGTFSPITYEPPRGKTNNLHRRKQ